MGWIATTPVIHSQKVLAPDPSKRQISGHGDACLEGNKGPPGDERERSEPSFGRGAMTELAKPRRQETRRAGKANGAAGDGQIVVVLQGGGALGAFQAGVYHALHEAGIEPDWVIGTSIGAINAAIIVGNEPENRLTALQQFWERISHQSSSNAWPQFTQALAN